MERELKKKTHLFQGNHSRSPKHIHGESRSLHRDPQLSAYMNMVCTH